MKGPTHAVGGLAAGLAVSAATGAQIGAAMALTLGAAASSTWPDVDVRWHSDEEPHRDFPHSLGLGFAPVALASAAFYALLAAVLPQAGLSSPSLLGAAANGTPLEGAFAARSAALVAPGAALGYLSHLFLDATTKTGVWLGVPRGRRVGLPRKIAYDMKRSPVPDLAARGLLVAMCLWLAIGVYGPRIAAASHAGEEVSRPAGNVARGGLYVERIAVVRPSGEGTSSDRPGKTAEKKRAGW